jgi:hypothetical protein
MANVRRTAQVLNQLSGWHLALILNTVGGWRSQVSDDRDDRFARQRERLHRLSEEIEVIRKRVAENARLISGFRSRWARERLLLLRTDQAYGFSDR